MMSAVELRDRERRRPDRGRVALGVCSAVITPANSLRPGGELYCLRTGGVHL